MQDPALCRGTCGGAGGSIEPAAVIVGVGVMEYGFPTKVLTTAVVITIVCFVGVGWYVWDSYQAFKAMQGRDFRLQELSGSITSLGEALTMSALMGVATADPQWEERYQRLWPQL